MLTSAFNPLDPQLVEDPYTLYGEARERCPVHHFEPMGMYAALSWDAVWTIIREGRAEARFEEREMMRHGPGVVDEPYFKGFQDFVILKDGEEHARLRKSFAKT